MRLWVHGSQPTVHPTARHDPRPGRSAVPRALIRGGKRKRGTRGNSRRRRRLSRAEQQCGEAVAKAAARSSVSLTHGTGLRPLRCCSPPRAAATAPGGSLLSRVCQRRPPRPSGRYRSSAEGRSARARPDMSENRLSRTCAHPGDPQGAAVRVHRRHNSQEYSERAGGSGPAARSASRVGVQRVGGTIPGASWELNSSTVRSGRPGAPCRCSSSSGDAGIGGRRRQLLGERVPRRDDRHVAGDQASEPIDGKLNYLPSVAERGGCGLRDEIEEAAKIGVAKPLHPAPKIRRTGYRLHLALVVWWSAARIEDRNGSL
jgi:hypothetical protein